MIFIKSKKAWFLFVVFLYSELGRPRESANQSRAYIEAWLWQLAVTKCKQNINFALFAFYFKGQKRQRFRIIHLIEFIQTNNFHIYSTF